MGEGLRMLEDECITILEWWEASRRAVEARGGGAGSCSLVE